MHHVGYRNVLMSAVKHLIEMHCQHLVLASLLQQHSVTNALIFQGEMCLNVKQLDSGSETEFPGV